MKNFISQITGNNNDYCVENPELTKKIAKSQAPKVTMVTCCDSRMDLSQLWIEWTNQVFTIRNIWNIIEGNEWDVQYWVGHLKTPVLLILGHTNCWAVNAAINSYDKVEEEIKAKLDFIVPAVKWTTDWKTWV